VHLEQVESVLQYEENCMKTIRNRLLIPILAVIGTGFAVGCENMSQRDKNTAIGAGVGAAAGSVLTDGSAAGTVGGAAVGGVVGHEIDRDKDKDRKRDRDDD
jgi:osmotically inducible lipoprotein OsmB